MSKRNFKLLIIIIFIILLVIVVSLATRDRGENGEDNPGTGTNFLLDLLTFGRDRDQDPNIEPPSDVSGYIPSQEVQEEQRKRLSKISTMPIAGFSVFLKERFIETADVLPGSREVNPDNEEEVEESTPLAPATEFMPAVRYVAKSNGNLFQTFADKIDERRFGSTVIPGVHEALFGNNGEAVIMRYLKSDQKTITTFAGALSKEVLGADYSEKELTGVFLPEDITDLSMSKDTSRMFYVFNIDSGVAGTTALATGNDRVQVFDSQYTEWLSQWPTQNMITITTKPSFGVPGYMYSIDPRLKNLTKVLSGVNGMTTLTSPRGDLVLYNNNFLGLNIYDINTGNTSVLSVRTMPEKCVWGASNDVLYCAVPKFIDRPSSYPDSWYMGEVSFSDDIWRIDVPSKTASLILNPLAIEDPNSLEIEEIDAIKLALDPNEHYLFFVNKKDSFLWKFDLR